MTLIDSAELGVQAWHRRWLHARPEDHPSVPRAAHFRPPENRPYPWHKPMHGSAFWTSTYDERYGSGWCQLRLSEASTFSDLDLEDHAELIAGEEGEASLAADDFHLWLLRPDPGLPVWRIETLEDLVALVDRFRHVYGPTREGLNMDHVDWAAAAREIAAVNVTETGHFATRLTDPDTYTWDCESTVWLRWAFTCAEPMDLGLVRIRLNPLWWRDESVEWLQRWRAHHPGREPLLSRCSVGARAHRREELRQQRRDRSRPYARYRTR